MTVDPMRGFLVIKGSPGQPESFEQFDGPPVDLVAKLTGDISRVSEGLCPEGHGDLYVVPIRWPMAEDDAGPEAGWCGPCRRGYVARRHRHTEVCAGPDMTEAELFCAYVEGEPTVALYAPGALLLYEVPLPLLPEDLP